jgi:hypothetical protein
MATIPETIEREIRSRQREKLAQVSSGWHRGVNRRTLHRVQAEIAACESPRVIIRAGRRFGKTTYVADAAVEAFMAGKRVLYATPTAEQIATFWKEIKRALFQPITDGILKVNETEHSIERAGFFREPPHARIRAKTAWNADTLRGDTGDLLIFDEWQLMNEDAWGEVGAPMLLDNGGRALFIYTPPSIRSRSTSKANDPLHANT